MLQNESSPKGSRPLSRPFSGHHVDGSFSADEHVIHLFGVLFSRARHSSRDYPADGFPLILPRVKDNNRENKMSDIVKMQATASGRAPKSVSWPKQRHLDFVKLNFTCYLRC